MDELRTLCMWCMQQKGDHEKCPHCGYIEVVSREGAEINLPFRTLLNNRYIIGKVLGDGGFGITYLGYDKHLRVKLAIKEYFPRHLATRRENSLNLAVFNKDRIEEYHNSMAKFLAEARTVAKFHGQANIVDVKDYFESNGTAYIVMSYLEGVTLNELIEDSDGRIEFKEVLNVVLPVLEALKKIHDEGLLHRDISPENIYISKNGDVKLLDFGAARYTEENQKTMTLFLKEGYAPLEQYSKKGFQGPWTDIYAVAATIYDALTGDMPPAAMERVSEDTLIPPSKLGITIPGYAEKAMIKALSVKIEDRFQNVDEFEKALTSGGGYSSSKHNLVKGTEVASKSYSNIFISFAAALFLVIFGMFSYRFFYRDKDMASELNEQSAALIEKEKSELTDQVLVKQDKKIEMEKSPAIERPQYVVKKHVPVPVFKKRNKEKLSEKSLLNAKKRAVRKSGNVNKNNAVTKLDKPKQVNVIQKNEVKEVEKESPQRATLRKTCQRNNAQSCFKLAFLFEKGQFGFKNMRKAREYYEISCDYDYPTACFQTGKMMKSVNPRRSLIYIEKSLRLYSRSCSAGDGSACITLASILKKGEFVEKDIQRSATLFKRSCDLSHSYGCYVFATMWKDGVGMKRNLMLARTFFKKSCELNMKEGCYDFSEMAKAGRGGSIASKKAASSMKKACNLGLKKACL